MLDVQDLSDDQRRQVEAMLVIAIKGHVVMTSPCPRCGRAKMLMEKILDDGSIRHECRSMCGYLMIWKPRRDSVHEQVNPNTWRMEKYNREAFARRVHAD